MSLNRTPHDVLCVTHTLQTLQEKWSTENRSRVFKQTESVLKNKNPPRDMAVLTTSGKQTPLSQVVVSSRITASAIASYQQVVVSRSDLPSSTSIQADVHPIGDCKPTTHTKGSVRMSEQDYATAMAATEKQIITSVCNTFLVNNPPHGGTGSMIRDSHRVSVHNTSTGSDDIVSHACCAYVTPTGASTSKRIYLPIAAPTREQIANCNQNDVYNKNVQLNITSALSGEHIPVIFSSLTSSIEHGTVQINPNTAVKPLGTTDCCEELLFGKCRITSSPDFCIGMDVGSTYANAVRKYQKYGNVAIGEQITLVPMIHKRAPMVVSMSCPDLNLSEVVTSVSGQQTHARFGPNHPARVVEVLAMLTPFVQRCCEVSMNLPTETVEDLKEDNDMPVPTCKSVEHCFAHNAAHGVGAYVATHVFSLPTAILNTHLVDHDEHSSSELTIAAGSHNNSFPSKQEITVHVTALFGGAVTDRGLVT
jgi:hypothetical protein